VEKREIGEELIRPLDTGIASNFISGSIKGYNRPLTDKPIVTLYARE
jgi:hypothetical protein